MALTRRPEPEPIQPAPQAPALPTGGSESKSRPLPQSFIPKAPRYTFDDLILPEATLQEIRYALAVRDRSDLVFNTWGLAKTHKQSRKVGINLYGPPGTGKTMVAHAIADYLKKDLILINYADIESKYVGETPKNLTEAFRVAAERDAILFFDEADAILSRRVTNMSHATDTSVNQTRSVMLTLLNDYEGVILFATNYIANFDPAFMRRILAHIKFALPDAENRQQLLAKLIPAELPTDALSRLPELTEAAAGLSGSDIANAIQAAAFRGAESPSQFVETTYLLDALRAIKESLAANRGEDLEVRVETRTVSEAYARNAMKSTGREN